MKNKKTVGERIKEVRTEKGLTGNELATMSGINANSIYMCEKDKTCPNLENAARICKALDISLDWLALAYFDDEEDSERF